MSLSLPPLEPTLRHNYDEEHHREWAHSNFWPDDRLGFLPQGENTALDRIRAEGRRAIYE